MNTPTFPIIYVHNENFITFIRDPKTISKMRASDFIDKHLEREGHVYDNIGNKWGFSSTAKKFKETGISRFLAKTIYNPMIDVHIHWKHEGTYELKEIKEIVARFIRTDKGIMKQLMGADFIDSMIEISPSVADMVELLKDYQFGLSGQQYSRELEHNKQMNNRSRN